MHGYVERYFRAWEVSDVELHVSPRNDVALNLYRALIALRRRVRDRRPCG